MCFAAPIDNMVGLVTVEAILTSRQLREKLQCLYMCKNLMSNNLCKTAVLRNIWIVNLSYTEKVSSNKFVGPSYLCLNFSRGLL